MKIRMKANVFDLLIRDVSLTCALIEYATQSMCKA
jgi:hypothetical protein